MSLDTRKPVEAKRMGDSLVAAFHRANPPLVWRFDLERNHSFTLALQGDEGEWELGLTSPKGDFHPVARFAVREDAEDAFVKIEKILAKSGRPWFKISIRGVLLVILLLILTFLVLVIGDFVAKFHGGASSLRSLSAATLPAPVPPPEIKPGVPLSADDYLKPPQ